MKKLSLFVLAALLGVASLGAARPANAQSDVQPIAYGETVEGNVPDAETPALFAFEGSEGDVVTITTDPLDSGLELVVFLVQVVGEELEQVNNSNTGELVDEELPADAIYGIIVVAASGDGDFEVTLQEASTGGNESGNTGGNTEIPESDVTAEVVTGRLNVRSGPSTDFTVVGQLTTGEVVPVLAIYEDAQWLVIAYQDGVAFISSLPDLVSLDGDLTTLPILTAEGELITQEGGNGGSSGGGDNGGGDNGEVNIVSGGELSIGDTVDIDVENENDYVAHVFVAEEGDLLTIVAESDDMDLRLDLYDDQGNLLIEGDSNVLEIEVGSDSTFILGVATSGGTGTYTISIEQTDSGNGGSGGGNNRFGINPRDYDVDAEDFDLDPSN
jgi:hypothetical protein